MKNLLKLSLVAVGIFLATISMSTNLQANNNEDNKDVIRACVPITDDYCSLGGGSEGRGILVEVPK